MDIFSFIIGQSLTLELIFLLLGVVKANDDAKRLLDDLFSVYNNVARPVLDESHKIDLRIGLKLSQIADIDEKNQIMTTNVWLRQVTNSPNILIAYFYRVSLFMIFKEWIDYKVNFEKRLFVLKKII